MHTFATAPNRADRHPCDRSRTDRRPADRLRSDHHRAGHRRSERDPFARTAIGGGPASTFRRGRPAPQPASPAPNYALRRVLAALALVAVLVGAGTVASGVVRSFGGAPAVAAGAPSAPSPAVDGVASGPARHVVGPGDTLWGIASEYRGAVAHDRYLEALIRLNGGTEIEIGQAVRLP